MNTSIAHARPLEPTAADIEKRLAYVDFGDVERDSLKVIAPLVTPSVEALTARFFEYLGKFPEAQALVRDPVRFETARRLKREHLRAMVAGPFDQKYVADRLELARVYAAAGIENRVFIGAFQHLISAIGALIAERAKTGDAALAFKSFMVLQRIAFFDLTLITDALVSERERTIRQQQDAIRELSTPVLQVRDRLLIVPLVGVVDSHRARELTEGMLRAIRDRRAKAVVMDVTGVPIVDSKVANHFAQACEAARLMGAHVILTGISAEIAQAMVTIGAELEGVPTVSDLQDGIEEAEKLLGVRANGAAA